MSRCGYSEDLDPLELGRWRAQVRSAITSHGASDHSCFRRDLADKALALLLGEKDL